MARKKRASNKPPKEPITYKVAKAVKEVADQVIDEYFHELLNINIGYTYRSKAVVKDGVADLAKCKKQSPSVKAHHGLDYIIEVAHDQWKVLNDHCRHALLYHQFMHIKVEEKDDGKLVMGTRKHEVEMFQSELKIFGPWTMEMEVLVENAKGLQLDLFTQATKRLRDDGKAGTNGTAAKPNGNGKAAGGLDDLPFDAGDLAEVTRDINAGGKRILEEGQIIEVDEITLKELLTADGIQIPKRSWDGLKKIPKQPLGNNTEGAQLPAN